MANLKYTLGIVCLLFLVDSATATAVAIVLPPSDTTETIAHDKPVNSNLAVEIVATNLQNYTFSQDPNDGTFAEVLDYPSLKIKVAAAPSASLYTLTVTAHGTDLSSTDTRVITVTVTGAGNANNHAPVFAALPGPVNIVEDASTGTSVLTVTATDADITSPENEITYSIGGSTFSIDGTSGLITLAAALNYTSQSIYELLVTATDGASPPKSATITATVSVQTRPDWVHSTSLTIDIPEDTTASSDIYTLAATDEDNSGSLQYSLVSQSPASPVMFTVVGAKVKSVGTFDVDPQNAIRMYTLTLRVSDSNYKATPDAKLQINVTDVNDSPPVFDSSTYSVTVTDDTPADSSVITVIATDADYSDANNIITYSLRAQDTDAFSINVTSGDISVNDASRLVDYAKNAALVVIATDNGSPPKSASTTVTVNDNSSGQNSFHGIRWHVFMAVACLLIVLNL